MRCRFTIGVEDTVGIHCEVLMKRPLDFSHIEVIDDVQAEIYRQMTPAQRIQIAVEANEMARMMLKAQIERMHPDWSEAKASPMPPTWGKGKTSA